MTSYLQVVKQLDREDMTAKSIPSSGSAIIAQAAASERERQAKLRLDRVGKEKATLVAKGKAGQARASAAAREDSHLYVKARLRADRAQSRKIASFEKASLHELPIS